MEEIVFDIANRQVIFDHGDESISSLAQGEKIPFIKHLRTRNSLGLKEAKHLADFALEIIQAIGHPVGEVIPIAAYRDLEQKISQMKHEHSNEVYEVKSIKSSFEFIAKNLAEAVENLTQNL